jgi:Arc/MetJ family transcription regulator
MTKRLIDIDDGLLERARIVAAAGTIRSTVEIALQRLVDQDTALRHVRRLRGAGALDPALVEAVRSPRASDA